MYLRHFALTRLPFETPAHTDENCSIRTLPGARPKPDSTTSSNCAASACSQSELTK